MWHQWIGTEIEISSKHRNTKSRGTVGCMNRGKVQEPQNTEWQEEKRFTAGQAQALNASEPSPQAPSLTLSLNFAL